MMTTTNMFKVYKNPDRIRSLLHSRADTAHVLLLGQTRQQKCFLLGHNRRMDALTTFGGSREDDDQCAIDTIRREGKEEHHNVFQARIEKRIWTDCMFALQRNNHAQKRMYTFALDLDGDDNGLEDIDVLNTLFQYQLCMDEDDYIPYEEDDYDGIVAVPLSSVAKYNFKAVPDIEGRLFTIRNVTKPTLLQACKLIGLC
jgi:hypothetical protein